MIRVSNEGGGLVTLWSYTLSSVEKKYPPEEKELVVLACYWGTLKDLAQGTGIKVITKSQVHRYLTLDCKNASKREWSDKTQCCGTLGRQNPEHFSIC